MVIMYKNMRIVLLIIILLSTILTYSQTNYSIRHFTTNDGLLSNKRIKVCQDGRGYYWFGSEKGLQRFDGYTFRSYPVERSNKALPQYFSVNMLISINDSLVLAATSIGLLEYSYTLDRVKHISILNDSSLYDIRKLLQVDNETILISPFSHKGLLEYNIKTKILKQTQGEAVESFKNQDIRYFMPWLDKSVMIVKERTCYQFNYKTKQLTEFDRSKIPINILISDSYLDKTGALWLATDRGLYIKENKDKAIKRITSIDRYCSLKEQIVRNIMPCGDSCIYVGFDWQGVFVLNIYTRKISSVIRKENPKTLGFTSNMVQSIFSNNKNILWVCGDGAFLIQSDISDAKFYSENDKSGLSASAILKILEDSRGNIWVATDGGGLNLFNHKTGTFTSFQHQNEKSNAPGSNEIVCLYEERNHENLWIGTYAGGLSCYNYSTKKFTNYYYNENRKNCILKNNIWNISQDSNDNIIASSFCESLSKLDRKTGMWTNVTVADGGIRCDCVHRLLIDPEKRLWIGYSDCGLDLLDQSKFKSSNKVPTPVNRESIECIANDGNRLWLGTLNGLRLFDKEKMQYSSNKICDFFKEKKVNCVLKDSYQRLWIATENGIYFADEKTGKVSYSNLSDFFTGYEITTIEESKKGLLLVGGRLGMAVVSMKNAVTPIDSNFAISIAEFRLFKDAVLPDSKMPLETNCNEVKSISLPYDKNYIGFSFSVLNLSISKDIIYECKLIGTEDKWTPLESGKNSVEYSNLSPGKYEFWVKAALKNNPDVFKTRMIVIQINPPFWKDKRIQAVLILIIFVTVILLYKRRINTLKKRQIELENAVKERTIELELKNKEIETQTETLEDQYISLKEKQIELEKSNKELLLANSTKIKLFSIVSHDLKSPFAGVTGLIKIMLNNIDSFTKDKITKILEDSVISLTNIQTLLDNLLQWSSSQSNNIVFDFMDIDVKKIIEETCLPLDVSCKNKEISLILTIDEGLFINVDRNTISIVIRNIVQNAIKFTPQNGIIHITATSNGNHITISVKDTGYGIPKDIIEQLNNDNIVNISQTGTSGEMGTGLGLAICKEFLYRHSGSISIESELNEGTTVNIVLPILKNVVSIINDKCETKLKTNIQNTTDFNILKDSIILVVDDNSLIREHLRLIIEPYAKVVDASNGEEGILKAHEYIPDIIICDVAMPIVDGFTLCETLSKNIETSHIPIILLTAKTANIARIEGLQKGATDYITKPFIEQEILLKICNILNVRLNLQKHLQKRMLQSFLQENPIEPIEPVLDKINELIRQHYINSNFSVEFICNEMAMSRTTLNRKIKSVFNSSPNEMINEYRLSQGLKLLRSTQLTISEVAYAVGFSDPKYFTRKFKEKFGRTPSEV